MIPGTGSPSGNIHRLSTLVSWFRSTAFCLEDNMPYMCWPPSADVSVLPWRRVLLEEEEVEEEEEEEEDDDEEEEEEDDEDEEDGIADIAAIAGIEEGASSDNCGSSKSDNKVGMATTSRLLTGAKKASSFLSRRPLYWSSRATLMSATIFRRRMSASSNGTVLDGS